MRMRLVKLGLLFAIATVSVAALLVAGGRLALCGMARLPVEAGYGPSPVLPGPRTCLVPTVAIAPAHGWSGGGKPRPASGLAVSALASDLAHPRWLLVLPNGDVLVTETDAPARMISSFDIGARIVRSIMRRAGAAGPSANRITLLRIDPQSGAVRHRGEFLSGLNSPTGMALAGGRFYVANTDALMRFDYSQNATRITAPGVRFADLPAGPPNMHWARNVIANPDGKRLFVTVGSNSDAGEGGMANEAERAAILEFDVAGTGRRVFASGLRNPNGLAFQPGTGTLWTTVNERDGLGPDLVPDYMTAVRDGGFYGWPYSYFGANVDHHVQPQDAGLVKRAIAPDYGLGSHTAPLGLVFVEQGVFPEPFRNGAFVALHGSSIRLPRSGYKVVFVPFRDGRPHGQPIDVLTGFLSEAGGAYGRPVSLAFDGTGALLVSDDVGGTIWRVTAAATQ